MILSIQVVLKPTARPRLDFQTNETEKKRPFSLVRIVFMRFNNFRKRARDRDRADESSSDANPLDTGEPAVLMALKHGILSTAPVIEGLESIDDWNAHRDRIIREIDPVGALESAYAQRAAAYLWRIERVARYRSKESRSDSEDPTIEPDRRTRRDRSMIETVAKYEAHLNRLLAQTMAELRRMQKEREKRSRRIDDGPAKNGSPSVAFKSIPIERYRNHASRGEVSPNAVDTPTVDPQVSPASDASSKPTDPNRERSKE